MMYRNIGFEKYWRTGAWYAVVYVAMMLEWWLMKDGLGIAYANTFGTMLKCAGDVALLLFPYWLLGPKWRWTALIPVWIGAIWGVANLAYFRFWNELIPAASVTMAGNVDGDLMEYGVALLRWSNLGMVAIPCVAWIGLRVIRPKLSVSFRPGWKCMLTAASLLMAAIGQLSYIKTTHAWRNAESPTSIKETLTEQYLGGYNGERHIYLYSGPAYYGIKFAYDAIDVLTASLQLSEEQCVEIEEFLKDYEREAIPDTIGSAARHMKTNRDSMNVVYIIVESLNADMVGKRIGNMEIMPTLDSLTHMDRSVVIDNIVSQIKISKSSDGHLLLMTGLLPPDKTSYSITYGSRNRFPSLADALPDHAKYLLLADEGICWNEGNTLRNFGLGEPLAIRSRPQYPLSDYGRDGAMFSQAIEMLKSVRQPFFMTLMTMSMHIPFKEEAWPLRDELKNAEGLTQMEKDYANMCSYTDRWIGKFLKALPENTLVVIASDHHQEVASAEASDTRAFFMAVNTGRTERISRTVGQLNLFPATLDILGVESGYGGLARSAFDVSVDGTMDSYGNIYGTPSQGALDTLRRAYGISDLIIRGDYFQARGR